MQGIGRRYMATGATFADFGPKSGVRKVGRRTPPRHPLAMSSMTGRAGLISELFMKSRLQSARLDRLTLCCPLPDFGQRMTLGAARRGDAKPRRMTGKAVSVQRGVPALEHTGAQHQMRVAKG